jgi:hypothetical protein
MARRSLKVSRLLLDLANPRITKAGGQHEALQKIIDDQDIKLVALAESIVENGLNPMDRFLILKSDTEADKFIVLEGNRRLAALRILNNPAVLHSLELRTAMRKRFEELSQDFDLTEIEPVECFEVPDRATGAMWIQQRHTGENDGIGIVGWSGVASARFRGNDPALQALDLVIKYGDLKEEEKEIVGHQFPITTLDRLLSTPDVRKRIGVEVGDDKLKTALPATEVMKPLRRIVLDLATKTVNVNHLKKKGDQVAYVDKLGKDLPDLTRKSGTAKPVETLDERAFKGTPRTKHKPRPRVPIRKALIPKSCHLNVTNSKVAEIYKELRTLPLLEYPHAISVLFRVFLEQSVDHYLTGAHISLFQPPPNNTKDKTLRTKMDDAIDHMIKVGGMNKRHLDGVSKGVNDKNSPLYIGSLNNYVHNRFFSPTERELKVAFDNSQPFFEKIWP